MSKNGKQKNSVKKPPAPFKDDAQDSPLLLDQQNSQAWQMDGLIEDAPPSGDSIPGTSPDQASQVAGLAECKPETSADGIECEDDHSKEKRRKRRDKKPASNGEFQASGAGPTCEPDGLAQPKPEPEPDGEFMTADGGQMSMSPHQNAGQELDQAIGQHKLAVKSQTAQIDAARTRMLLAHAESYQEALAWEERLNEQIPEEPLHFVEKTFENERDRIFRYFDRKLEEFGVLESIHKISQDATSTTRIDKVAHIRQQIDQLSQFRFEPDESLQIAGYGKQAPVVETGVDENGNAIEMCHGSWDTPNGQPLSLPPVYLHSDEPRERLNKDFALDSEGTRFRMRSDEFDIRHDPRYADDSKAGKALDSVDAARSWPDADGDKADAYDLAVRAAGKLHGNAEWEEGGWDAFRADFGVMNFCGHPVPGHYLLHERLEVAERALQNWTRRSGKELGEMLEIRQASGKIRLGKSSSYHSLGLSIDINASTNPWIAGHDYGSTEAAARVEKIAQSNVAAVIAIWRAVWLTGKGDPYSPASAAEWEGTTEEIYDRLAQTNEGLELYMSMRKRNAETDDMLMRYVGAVHPTSPPIPPLNPATRLRSLPSELQEIVGDVVSEATQRMVNDQQVLGTGDPENLLIQWRARIDADANALYETDSGGSNWAVSKDTDDGKADRKVKDNGFLDLSRQLVVALHDVAGLAWGAVDFGGYQNGDMMHFDCRNIPAAATLKELVKAPDKSKEILG